MPEPAYLKYCQYQPPLPYTYQQVVRALPNSVNVQVEQDLGGKLNGLIAIPRSLEYSYHIGTLEEYALAQNWTKKLGCTYIYNFGAGQKKLCLCMYNFRAGQKKPGCTCTPGTPYLVWRPWVYGFFSGRILSP